MLRKSELIDSLFGLFWLYLGFGLPFGILVLRGFMQTIPKELIDAAHSSTAAPGSASSAASCCRFAVPPSSR